PSDHADIVGASLGATAARLRRSATAAKEREQAGNGGVSVTRGGTDMADDKSKRDFRDRDRVSADEDYEVEYFAQKVWLTPQQVRELIKQHGNDRQTLEREAKSLGRGDKNASLPRLKSFAAKRSSQLNRWTSTSQ
ncbi:DUF3606 domain-containing protein, partial [Mesorhizobium sp. M2A.F.Ca.ET.067.02.1.1]